MSTPKTDDTLLPKILLVEDDETYAKSLIQFLEFMGYEVVHVDSLDGAMRSLDQRFSAHIFDCIILDGDLSQSKSFPGGPPSMDVLRSLKPERIARLGIEKAPPVIANSGEAALNRMMEELGAQYIGAKDINKIKAALAKIFPE